MMKTPPRTEYDVVKSVCQAWMKLPSTTIESCWVTLSNVLREIRACGGGNRFKTPRKRKYAPMRDAGDASEDEWLDHDTITDAGMMDDVKPEALREPAYDTKDDAVTAASV